ncbi:MAG TPA: flagellar export chaperone FlgN [Fibrobacteria bacterium]|nr:flagellar export chaperone FlgN [Fibrobacteria bacterium]
MGSAYREMLLGEEFADLLEAPAAAAVAAAAPVDREALCETLIANMDAQMALYAAYLDQANRQRLALVNRRLMENHDVNREADRLVNGLASLEEERVAVTERIVGPRRTGEASTPVKCEAIYPLVSPARAERLKECRDRLLNAVGELKRALAVNLALVENGSKIVHTTIGIMTSVAGRTKTEKMNTYTAKGNVNVARLQIRNLVNRSV